MKLVLNNVQFINDRKIQFVLCTWATIEILQNTKFVSNYFVMHLSSFFGAIVLLYFIDFYKKSKWLKIAPIFIEIIHSLYFQGVVDMEDVIFSLLGIIAYTVVFKSKKNIK